MLKNSFAGLEFFAAILILKKIPDDITTAANFDKHKKDPVAKLSSTAPPTAAPKRLDCGIGAHV